MRRKEEGERKKEGKREAEEGKKGGGEEARNKVFRST